MISQSQNLKLSQKLFPKVILNQSVLAVPTLALEQMIKKELEENVLLEEESPDEVKDETQEEKDLELKSKACQTKIGMAQQFLSNLKKGVELNTEEL